MKKFISVLFVLIIAFSVCACTDNQPEQTFDEVLSNGGIAAKQGEWTYFINGGMPEYVTDALSTVTARGKIYKMNDDGSVCEAVTTKKAQKFYIYNDKIFYISPTQTKLTLYRINNDGKKNKAIFTFDDKQFVEFGKNGVAIAQDEKIYYINYADLKKQVYEVGDVNGIYLTDEYIYYYADNKSGLKRIGYDSQTSETLCEDIGQILYADDNMLYFSCVRVPQKVNVNTLEQTALSTALYKNMIFSSKHQYIIAVPSDTEDTGLYRQPVNTVAGEENQEKRLKIHPKEVLAYCLTDDFIFFVEAESGNIYRMTYSGEGKTVLGTVSSVYNADSMDVVDDKLFIFDSMESGCCYYVKTDATGQLTLAVKEG